MRDDVRKLIEWIAEETEAEPGPMSFLGFDTHHVHTKSLLDKISECFGVSPEAIGDVFNPIREKIEER